MIDDGTVRAPYARPTISASRLKSIGGEKGAPGCERRLAGHYLFGMKQASTAALEFGSALHSSAEHLQATGELLEPESDVGRVLTAGAHLLSTAGRLLVEYEHVGTLPDGSPYVAYIDGHTECAQRELGTIVIQDLKTTSNPRYALTGTDEEDISPEEAGDYDLRRDIQCMFYAWILLCDPHWFCPPLPSDQHYGPKHWQWWDPVERFARTGRLRWVYFLTKGVPRAWEANAWVTPEQAQAYMIGTIMLLVARINALHEWHYARAHATLDEIDRTPAACNNRGRWCGVGERDACNFDKLGTPALDLVQLKVRKMTTPQERLAMLQAQRAAKMAPSAASVTEAPAASPPPAPAPIAEAPTAPAKPATDSTPVVQDAPASSTSAPAAAEAEQLTKGQRAAATRAANKAKQAAAAPPPAAGINPPAEEGPAPAPEMTLAECAGILAATPLATEVAAFSGEKTCPDTDALLPLLNALVGKVPVGVTITIVGQR